MIIVKIIGGLGNQMFQYSLGRSIAVKNNVELKLDISAFDSYKLHSYQLDKFNIIENIATYKEIKGFTRWKIEVRDNFKRYYEIFEDILNPFTPYYRRKYVKERDYTFDSNILKIRDNVYLDGYWGCEKYFKEIESIIKKEFTIKDELDSENLNMANEILGTESVSLHIRRGDYVSDPQTNKIHGTCSLNYYFQAIDEICKLVSEPHFFIFSDDPDWVKNNFSIPFPVQIISFNGSEKPHLDLHLMSLCKHHIIANSTFSWWGAWLSENPKKMVLAPKTWVNVPSRNISDLIPDDWIKING